jgi:hypothetical protein
MHHSHHTFTATSASFQLRTSIFLHHIFEYLRNGALLYFISLISPSPGITTQCFISRGLVALLFLAYAQ